MMEQITGRVTLHSGDCLDILPTLAECSIDSCVTDPPYGLSFMGRNWDHGVPGIPFWKEVYRTLKPGAHLAAFGGSRTYHRMACAIEDAGFEIRDSLMWVYGVGFPKSHDVSKGIDKLDAADMRRERQLRFTEWMRSSGLTSARIDELTGTNMGGHYTTAASQPAVATRDHFETLRPHFGCAVPQWVEAIVDERTVESENFKRREVVGEKSSGLSAGTGTTVGKFTDSRNERGLVDITAPATDAAREWQGWGTALKPAFEPIVLARKPLSEKTVAENVLRWRTGALNIDGCRIGTETRTYTSTGNPGANTQRFHGGDGRDPEIARAYAEKSKLRPPTTVEGRWPANVCHDGSDEVVAAFPNSAARFFYSAKASKADRAGSKHPTVKPVSLMQWLCRLITPPGGTILDPFAGSGTTGAAAAREGLRAVLIEREAEYQQDIRNRFATSADLLEAAE